MCELHFMLFEIRHVLISPVHGRYCEALLCRFRGSIVKCALSCLPLALHPGSGSADIAAVGLKHLSPAEIFVVGYDGLPRLVAARTQLVIHCPAAFQLILQLCWHSCVVNR